MGIDIGSYSSKGVVVDASGYVLAYREISHGMEHPRPGFFEHDAEDVWWGDFCRLSRSLLGIGDADGIRGYGGSVSPASIRGVGSSALGGDCLPVDESFTPLRKAILYGIDSRCSLEIEEMTRMYGREGVRRLFGRPICTGDVAAKILWLKKHEPDIHKSAKYFLTGSSFLTTRLTGNCTVDRFLGMASFRPLYDENGRILKEMCSPYCRPDQLAPGMEAAEIAGYVTEAAASATGIWQGTPVITGTGDSAAEAVSAGVLKPGELMIQFGSSLFFYFCTERLIEDDRVRGNTFVIPGTYSLAAGTNNSGTLQTWYRNVFFPELENEHAGAADISLQAAQDRSPQEVSPFARMMEGLEEIPPGSEGLITLPYFAGERTPINDPLAKGVIFGLTLSHTRRHLYRSALEGIGFSAAQHIEIFREHGLPVEKIHAVGGGAKNLLWMKMIADITGVPVSIGRVTAGASYGDALMAAIGCGQYQTFSDLESVLGERERILPDEERTRLYVPYYHAFCSLYDSTKTLMHQF